MASSQGFAFQTRKIRSLLAVSCKYESLFPATTDRVVGLLSFESLSATRLTATSEEEESAEAIERKS